MKGKGRETRRPREVQWTVSGSFDGGCCCGGERGNTRSSHGDLKRFSKFRVKVDGDGLRRPPLLDHPSLRHELIRLAGVVGVVEKSLQKKGGIDEQKNERERERERKRDRETERKRDRERRREGERERGREGEGERRREREEQEKEREKIERRREKIEKKRRINR